MLKAFDATPSKPSKKLVNSMLSEYMRERNASEKAIRAVLNGVKTDESAYDLIMSFEEGALPRDNGTASYKRTKFIYDWYVLNKKKIRNKPKFKLVEGDSFDGRNNRIFDIQYAVLTNLDTADKMFNPGNFDPQKKIARIVNILKANKGYTYNQLAKMTVKQLDALNDASSNLNINLSTTQVYFHKQNMTAGKLIGIFANNNTSHAFISMQDVYVNVGDGFIFDGISVTDESNNKLDKIKAHNGEYISKNIAGFLAASVDAVKDPVLNYLNLNTMTTGPAMVLARLGFDVNSIGLFMTQPIIERLSSEYFKRNNEGYTTVDTLIDEVLEDYKSEGLDWKLVEKNLHNINFNKEDMAISLNDSLTDSSQLEVLLLFRKLSEIAGNLNTLTFLTKFNSVSNAVGPSIADTLVMRERVNRFTDAMNSQNPPFSNSALDVIKNNPILEAFYDTTVADEGASRKIFMDYFPHYSGRFTAILDLLRTHIKGTLDSKIINSLVSDFMLYKLTYNVIDSSYENRYRMIHKFVDEFNEKSKEITDNELLDIINVVASTAKCPVKTLEAKTGGYSIDVQERIKDSWSNLFNTEYGKELATDLFMYNIMRSGFIFSPKTFLHLASVDVKLGIDNYVESIRDPEFNDMHVDANAFMIQFLRNHSQNSKLVPELKDNARIDVNKKGDTISFTFDENKTGMSPIITLATQSKTIYSPVIKYDNSLYRYVSDSSNTVKYVRTTSLGNQNNFLEYNIIEGMDMKSALPISDQEIDTNSAEEIPIWKKSFDSTVFNKDVAKTLDLQFEKADADEVDGFLNDVLDNSNIDKQKVKEEVKKKTKNRCI